MNVYLLELIGKWISFTAISVASFFGSFNYVYNTSKIDNINLNIESNVVSKVLKYETIKQYNNKIPSGTINVITKGVDGISYVKEDGTVDTLSNPVNEVLEIGTGAKGEYVGSITNYGPDCAGCSKVGNVSCRTREGKNLSLYDTIYYDDIEYGEVRILAATRDVFPCGTIINVSKGNVNFYGVVLDTGGAMNSAWREKGYILIDLAHASQQAAISSGLIHGTGVNYKVIRWGW